MTDFDFWSQVYDDPTYTDRKIARQVREECFIKMGNLIAEAGRRDDIPDPYMWAWFEMFGWLKKQVPELVKKLEEDRLGD